MLRDEIEREVIQLFGLRAFRAGPKLLANPNVPGGFEIEFQVNLLWVAIVYYFKSPIAVSILQTDSEYKGLLIDPGKKMVKHSLPVVITDWEDPVQKALQSMNLAPSQHFLDCQYHLQLSITTPLIDSKLTMGIVKQDPGIDQVSKAVLETIHKIALLYGGRDWQDFFTTRADEG